VVQREPHGPGGGSRTVLSTDLTLRPSAADTPRSAYRALERRATLTTAGLLVALSAVAWWLTLDGARDMEPMVWGFADVGSAMPFSMAAPVFLAMWTTMMVAMMFPTVMPIVLLHRLVVRRRGEGPLPTVAFAAGYLVIWAVAGLVPLAALIGFRSVAEEAAWVDRAGGAVLVTAGLYQFTRWKETCQRACRSPLTFLTTHDFGGGSAGALRTGVSHGLFCLGCCWALMAVLVVVGLMNLVWMAGIAIVFLAEKHWRRGAGLARVVGTAVALFGAAVLVHPALLDSVVPMDGAAMTGE
jgi:predicted metal-binding membrane protein